MEPLEGLALADSDVFAGRLAYCGYGVISLTLDLSFTGTWQSIIELTVRWMNAPDLERRAADVLAEAAKRRRSLWLHNGPFSPGPRLCSRIHGCDHSRDRIGVPVPSHHLRH